MSFAIPARAEARRSDRPTQLAVAVAAIAAMAGLAWVLVWVFMPAGAAPVPKNPFGMGLREAAPGGSALGRTILFYQASFNRALEAALSAMKREGGSPWPLVTLGFAYGVFHAAGPGHGKGIISAYLVTNERALARGFAIGLAAALLQGAVAIGLVAILAIGLHATAPTVTRASDFIEVSSFVVVTLLGLFLVWRKAGRLVALLRGSAAGAACGDEACGHVHMPSPDAMRRMRARDLVAVIIAAGARPCAGAILILVFALSQNLFVAGIAAVLAMSLGTAATTGAVAALAVFAKRVALRFAAGQGRGTAVAGAGFELAVAAFVAVLGASLVLGLSAGIAAG